MFYVLSLRFEEGGKAEEASVTTHTSRAVIVSPLPTSLTFGRDLDPDISSSKGEICPPPYSVSLNFSELLL